MKDVEIRFSTGWVEDDWIEYASRVPAIDDTVISLDRRPSPCPAGVREFRVVKRIWKADAFVVLHVEEEVKP